MGPPAALTLALQRRLGIQDFIETGTFHGHTTAWAARHFNRVTTIELSPTHHTAEETRFCAQPNGRTLAGDSGVTARSVAPNLAAPAIFRLDAHWSGLDTAGREVECPVLAESALINVSSLVHVVLFENAFVVVPAGEQEWLAEVLQDMAADSTPPCSGLLKWWRKFVP